MGKYKLDRAIHGHKSVPCKESLAIFLKINQEHCTSGTCSQIAYEKSLVARMKENPKLFHSYISLKKQFYCSTPQASLWGAVRWPSGNGWMLFIIICECICQCSPWLPSKASDLPSSLDHINLTVDDVLQILLHLDGNSTMGPVGLHPMLVKSGAAKLAYPLFIVFSWSLDEGSLLVQWKMSLVIPIFKKGSWCDALNYRPVSLTSVPCKCLEKLISHELNSFLTDQTFSSMSSLGFVQRYRRSTNFSLPYLTLPLSGI